MGGRRGLLIGLGAFAAAVLAAAVLAAGARDDGDAAAVPSSTSTTSTTTATTAPPTTLAPTTTTTVVPVPATLVPVVAGEAPVAAGDPVALAQQIVEAERAIRDPATPTDVLAAAGRLQQVTYRRLGERPEWEPEVLANAPVELHEAIWRQATARREFRAMHRRLGENLPAWRIVDPLPAEELLALYAEAEAEFGVPWNVLAAVHLVETGLGRIVGLSTAGAQGPMQFMPATWAAYGMGGDVWNTRDAIRGAANYLAANGGGSGTPDGVAGALFHYNHSDHYVQGVLHYAEVLRVEPRSFLGFHAWQVVYLTVHGDVVLPTGYEQTEPIPAADWIAANGQT